MWFLTMARSVNSVNITGNPFATTSVRSIGQGGGYANFEIELAKNLSAVVINDQHLVDDKGYLKKPSKNSSQQHLPYPNPIKLMSREVQKEIKGDYLNAEKMHKGIALPISDIRPNTNIESEIFPKQLTKEAQSKEVFTPPGHPQMRFASNQDDMASKPEQVEHKQE